MLTQFDLLKSVGARMHSQPKTQNFCFTICLIEFDFHNNVKAAARVHPGVANLVSKYDYSNPSWFSRYGAFYDFSFIFQKKV